MPASFNDCFMVIYFLEHLFASDFMNTFRHVFVSWIFLFNSISFTIFKFDISSLSYIIVFFIYLTSYQNFTGISGISYRYLHYRVGL